MPLVLLPFSNAFFRLIRSRLLREPNKRRRRRGRPPCWPSSSGQSYRPFPMCPRRRPSTIAATTVEARAPTRANKRVRSPGERWAIRQTRDVSENTSGTLRLVYRERSQESLLRGVSVVHEMRRYYSLDVGVYISYKTPLRLPHLRSFAPRIARK